MLLSTMLTLAGAELALRLGAAMRAPKGPPGPRTEPIAPGNPTRLPLRGPRYQFEPEEFKIVTLGDSFTWGDGIWAEADVWPNRLEAILTERAAQPVGVVNLAVRGFTTVASARAPGSRHRYAATGDRVRVLHQ